MLNKKTALKFIFAAFVFVTSCKCSNEDNEKKQPDENTTPEAMVDFNGELKVLALNMWHEGTAVNGGFDAIADIILQTEADIVMLCETANYNETIFSNRIKDKMKALGVAYYTFHSAKSSTILSKYPIVSKPAIGTTSLTKCIVKLDESKQLAVYGAHLDYTHYACYLPRGYDGITWKKLPEPITNINEILQQNLDSGRDEAIEIFVNDAAEEQKKGNMVLLAGDFNEPSHLDWTETTKDLYDHNGTVVPWHNSVTLQESGYLDAYRVKYPDPVTHPGFTWAAFNTDVQLSKLVWTPEADDRDRIDFIYFNQDARLTLNDVIIVGPSGCIVNGQGKEDTSLQDKFLLPQGKWPTDHKGVLATFKIE
ncbi:endonuclease/exonuclease/phosphatase family protein [Aestuariivivens insulae]|uniref:endonuclease/exonuclease/phosphatase family protein n=1 Tax=Aestuariivivens insulae TaxID=1621988 RepID=UPI001F59ED5A|nr:endonuclease/exonuclease/phosphatase family protein [Aestuariivivens insulae]